MIKSLFIGMAVMLIGTGKAYAQELERRQRKQETTIQQAFKKKQVTEKEYYKLLQEQEVIKNAMKKAKADDYWSPKEKNEIYSKLQRAEKRLRKYKTNREVY